MREGVRQQPLTFTPSAFAAARRTRRTEVPRKQVSVGYRETPLFCGVCVPMYLPLGVASALEQEGAGIVLMLGCLLPVHCYYMRHVQKVIVMFMFRDARRVSMPL